MNPFWKYWEFKSTEKGRQYWEFKGNENDEAFMEAMMQSFQFDAKNNPNSADLVYRHWATQNKATSAPIEIPEAYQKSAFQQEVYTAFRKGVDYYQQLLTPHHFIPGDYGGPMFLLPGLIIVAYISNTALAPSQKSLMKAYMLNHQNQDGGWGLHIEGKSTQFGSCMNYVALRILGINKEDERLQKGRKWILENGGATEIPSWGKFYLSVLNVYEWKGNHSLFPEIWLLPKWLHFYPAKYWCHARMVYLPMAYAYGSQWQFPLNALTSSLREELYPIAYENIDWKTAKSACSEHDSFRKPSKWMKLMNGLTHMYEQVAPKFLRKKALDFIMAYIHAEDQHTNFINIGPVNQVLNSLAVWQRYGSESPYFQQHVDRWKDYLWVAEDGMKMQGYNGAQFWESAFTMNAIQESKAGQVYESSLANLYNFLDVCQIQEGIPKKNLFFRHPNEGGFPFSTVEHAWPITDCTADGIKTLIKRHQCLDLMGNESFPRVEAKRLEKAVDLVLSFQSEDGGWASYEQRRAPFWIEALNPSEIFGEIMVDYSYTECSSSSMQGLAKFAEYYPNYRKEDIKIALTKGAQFIKNQQDKEGGWYGSWGVCYTYGAWFGLEALACVGEEYSSSEEVQKACIFLVSKQQTDGSWGESYASCVEQRYVQHERGQIINTAWALIALMIAKYPDQEVIEKGLRFIISKQEANGDFPQEGISGVFNKNCMETYTSYRNVFPIWALNRYL